MPEGNTIVVQNIILDQGRIDEPQDWSDLMVGGIDYHQPLTKSITEFLDQLRGFGNRKFI